MIFCICTANRHFWDIKNILSLLFKWLQNRCLKLSHYRPLLLHFSENNHKTTHVFQTSQKPNTHTHLKRLPFFLFLVLFNLVISYLLVWIYLVDKAGGRQQQMGQVLRDRHTSATCPQSWLMRCKHTKREKPTRWLANYYYHRRHCSPLLVRNPHEELADWKLK